MLTRVVFLFFLAFSPLASAASASLACGPATLLAHSLRRGFLDSRLVSTQSQFVKALLKGKDAPLQFEVGWFSGKAYLIEPRFNTWMAVNGNALEIAYSDSENQPLRIKLEIPEQFRKSNFLNYFKSPTKAERIAFYEWYVGKVGPLLVEERWKQMADLMKANAFTWDKWEELVSLIELFAPQGMVLQGARAPYDRFRLHIARLENGKVRVTFHMWSPDVMQASYRFGMFFENWTQPVCDESWNAISSDDETDIRPTVFQSCKLSGELFSIARHRALFPEDTLSDLLKGLNAGDGGYLLDLYPHFGAFKMDASDVAAKKWKTFLETAIVNNTLRFVPENSLP